jgi:polysaccharide export outer membrane protein
LRRKTWIKKTSIDNIKSISVNKKNMISKTKVSGVSIFLLGITLLTGCVNTRESTYFVGQNDAELTSTPVSPQTIIAPNDLLGISVSSLNPSATDIFNTTTVNTYGQKQAAGYLVNKEGLIQFPVLGNIKAQGFTPEQLREHIIKDLLDKKLLVDPIVTVRVLNFKVTVLGEVLHPSVVDVPNEKISLLEALGMAGDITVTGKKDNVMVIREENDKKTIKRLDLTSTDLFKSPYYYLKPNDIVYVQANAAKVSSVSRLQQLLPIVLTSVSLAVSLAYLFLLRR